MPEYTTTMNTADQLIVQAMRPAGGPVVWLLITPRRACQRSVRMEKKDIARFLGMDDALSPASERFICTAVSRDVLSVHTGAGVSLHIDGIGGIIPRREFAEACAFIRGQFPELARPVPGVRLPATIPPGATITVTNQGVAEVKVFAPGARSTETADEVVIRTLAAAGLTDSAAYREAAARSMPGGLTVRRSRSCPDKVVIHLSGVKQDVGRRLTPAQARRLAVLLSQQADAVDIAVMTR